MHSPLFPVLAVLLCTCVRAQSVVPPPPAELLTHLDTAWRTDPAAAASQLDSLRKHASLDSARYIHSVQLSGRAHRLMGDYVAGIADWRVVYNYAGQHRDSSMLVEAADQIGIMNTFMGNLREGQQYLLQVAEIYDRIGSLTDRAGALNGLAILHNDLEEEARAIALYRQSLELYETADDTMGRANVHANLGLLYLNLGELDLAETHLRLQGHLDTLLQTDWGLGFHYDFMGALYKARGQYPEALRWSERGLALRQALPSHYNRAESHNSIAAILLLLDRPREAIGHARDVLAFRDQHQSLSQEATALEILSEAYRR